MNILSSEEMRQTQIQLLKIPQLSLYQLAVPSNQELTNIHHNCSKLFPNATQHYPSIQKIVKLNDNLKSIPLSDSNSLFRMLAYSLLTMLYQQKYRGSAQATSSNNAYLLETIKCSLYSKDVDLSTIKNCKGQLDNQQMKILGAHFFDFMEDVSTSFTTHRIQCIQWMLQHNPCLLQMLILLQRFILSKLGIEEADDYKKPVNQCEAITNLFQYFDHNYRNFGQLFLFYEDGLFVALSEGDIVMGEYFQNQRQKENQKKQLQIKSSVKRNMIESFLVNIEDRKNDENDELKKKPAIVESDVKLFNFLLDNSYSQQNSRQYNLIQKNTDIQTPHFNSGGEQLQFGKRRRDETEMQSIKDDIRQEFQKLIMDESLGELESQDLEQFNSQFNDAPTPFLGGGNHFNFNKNDKNFTDLPEKQSQYIQNVKIMDSPVSLLFQNCFSNSAAPQQQGKNYILHPKNRMSMQQKQVAPFTTQLQKNNQRDHGFSSVNNNNALFYQSKNGTTEQLNIRSQITNRSNSIKLANCQCRQIRLSKNQVDSKVVDFVFVPQTNKRNSNLYSITSPKFLNFKQGTNRESFDQRSLTPNKYIKDQNRNGKQQKNSQITEQRKPAFLKLLKGNKNQGKNAQKKIDQLQSTGERTTINKKSQQINKIPSALEKFKRQSVVIGSNGIQNQQPCSKSTNKQVARENRQKLSSQQSKDYKANDNIDMSARPGLGQPGTPWQTTSNFHQRPHYYNHLNTKSSHFQVLIPNDHKVMSPTKIYSPKQIQSPASNLIPMRYHNGNKVILKINDLNQGQKKTNPELLKSQQGDPKSFVNDDRHVLMNNRSDKILKYYTNLS